MARLICPGEDAACDPERIAALTRRIQSKGLRFLEVPLSGNSDQIALGNGVGLVGGNQADVDAAAPVLDVICPQRYHLGAVGAGGRAKLAVNLELIEGCLAHDEGELDNSAIIKEIRRRRYAKK